MVPVRCNFTASEVRQRRALELRPNGVLVSSSSRTYHEAVAGSLRSPGPPPIENVCSMGVGRRRSRSWCPLPSWRPRCNGPCPCPVGRVQLVAVCDVDPVEATAGPHHVGICGVLVGQNQVVATPRDDLVRGAVEGEHFPCPCYSCRRV